MDKLNELKALAELAQQLEDNGHYVEANTVHNQFIRLAQKQTGPIGPGESYTTIARQYGVSVDALKAANPPRKDQQDPSKLYPGDRLNLPAAVKPSGPFDFIQKGIDTVTDMFSGPKEAPKKPMAPVKKPITHEVLPGQSLSMIGKQFGIPWQKIKYDNGLESNTLRPGQRLTIKK
jgi:LysM repeat protein